MPIFVRRAAVVVGLVLATGVPTTAGAAELRKVEAELLSAGLGSVYPYQVVVSPDGAHVYTVSGTTIDNDPVVHALSRAADGSLSLVDSETFPFGDFGLYALAIPADGLHVYASSFSYIAIFVRDPSSGVLTPAGGVFDDVGGSVMAASPDGRNLYLGAGALLATYARDPSTGALTRTGLENGVVGPAPINGVAALDVSPDGRHVYVGSPAAFPEESGGAPPSLIVFARDETSGALTFVEALSDGIGGADGLTAPANVAVSPDGHHVYASGSEGGRGGDVAVFARDDASGALTFIDKAAGPGFREDVFGGIAVSPDGERVVVAGDDLGPCCFRDGISVFQRDPATGMLTLRETLIRAAGADARDLAGPTSVAFAPDGRDLYVTAGHDSVVTAYRVRAYCAAAPLEDCRVPTRPRRSRIVLADAAQDSLTWRWRSGEATSAAEFGDPSTVTDYAVCVHRSDGDGWETVAELLLPAGATCGDDARPCWRGLGQPAGAAGWAFRDPQRAHDGVSELRLAPGADGRASIQLRARGPALDLPALPLPATGAVVAQLKSGDGACWSATYLAPALVNDARRFADTSD